MTELSDLQTKAADHLWMHFARQSALEAGQTPIIVKGEGARIFDSNGRSYLDGLAGLFVVQAGHGREELARTAYEQAKELAFFPLWSYAHPQAIALADRLADYAPGDINKVFFTTGGGEAVEAFGGSRVEGHVVTLTSGCLGVLGRDVGDTSGPLTNRRTSG